MWDKSEENASEGFWSSQPITEISFGQAISKKCNAFISNEVMGLSQAIMAVTEGDNSFRICEKIDSSDSINEIFTIWGTKDVSKSFSSF